MILLTREDEWCDRAVDLVKDAYPDCKVYRDRRGEYPEDLGLWDHGILLSFLSKWIVPPSVLRRSTLAINFHPGPQEYPGIGCYNFALYEGAETYGAVAHHMAPKVDTGSIFMQRRFDMTDSVESLRRRTLTVMLEMLVDVLDMLPNIPTGNLLWTRKPFTRADLESLRIVTPDMDAEEIARRVRAVEYPGHKGVEMDVNGVRFAAQSGP